MSRNDTSRRKKKNTQTWNTPYLRDVRAHSMRQQCYLRRQNTRRDGDTSSQIRRMPFKMDDHAGSCPPRTDRRNSRSIRTYVHISLLSTPLLHYAATAAFHFSFLSSKQTLFPLCNRSPDNFGHAARKQAFGGKIGSAGIGETRSPSVGWKSRARRCKSVVQLIDAYTVGRRSFFQIPAKKCTSNVYEFISWDEGSMKTNIELKE